jgi:hypothetical protein
MTHCDREDFNFHYTYELHDGILKKLNVVDEVVESWSLDEAPEEELFAALDELRPRGDYSDDITLEEIRAILSEEL